MKLINLNIFSRRYVQWCSSTRNRLLRSVVVICQDEDLKLSFSEEKGKMETVVSLKCDWISTWVRSVRRQMILFFRVKATNTPNLWWHSHILRRGCKIWNVHSGKEWYCDICPIIQFILVGNVWPHVQVPSEKIWKTSWLYWARRGKMCHCGEDWPTQKQYLMAGQGIVVALDTETCLLSASSTRTLGITQTNDYKGRALRGQNCRDV